MAAAGSKMLEKSANLPRSVALRARVQIEAMEKSLSQIDQAIRDLAEHLRHLQGENGGMDGSIAISWERNRPVWVKWKALKGPSGKVFWTSKRIQRPIPSLKVENRTKRIGDTVRKIEQLRSYRTRILRSLGEISTFWNATKPHIDQALQEADHILQ